jgi:hypothetical protein
MAIALLLATGAATAGFLVSSYFGFVLAAYGAHDPMVRALVGRHVLFSIPAVLLSLFSQSMVLFYFIGTGRLVKDEVEHFPESEKTPVLRALRRFKAKTSPPATFSMLAAIFVFVIGGWVHTSPPGARLLPHWTHLGASVLAVGLHLWALFAEYPVFVENNELVGDPSAYAARITRSDSS